MRHINYDNKIFQSVGNSANGEVDATTRFYYSQQGNIVTATYQGGQIEQGQLIAIADQGGTLTMRYQHVNNRQELMTGHCISTPEILPNGKIRLHESWQWTSGDKSSGTSIIEEI